MLSVLDPLRIAAYARTLVSVTMGEGGSYFDALDRIQNRFQMEQHGTESPRLLFDLDERARAFLTCVLAESQLPGLAVERLSVACEHDARRKIVEALHLLKSYRPEMPMSIRQLMRTLVFAHVAGCAGGSSADALGTVWISPRPGWTAARYAECLCHELVHQALFLEDMLAPIFQLVDGEPMIVSSIRRCKRPYASSFHAAVVAGALIEMYLATGHPARAEEYSAGLADTVAQFRAMPQHLTPRGLEVLAELGRIVSSRTAERHGGGLRIAGGA